MEHYGNESYFYYKMMNPMECDICRRQIYVEMSIHQCLSCSKILCSTCNKYGLCAEDFEKLTTDQKLRLMSINRKQTQRIFIRFLLLIIMIFLIFISVLILMFTKNLDITFQFGFGLTMGVLLLGSFILFLYFHSIIRRQQLDKVYFSQMNTKSNFH